MIAEQPVTNVMWVDIGKITPNDYNPNSVAKKEMQLLYISIKHDGYTQPIVTIYDKDKDRYIIVDGFHRYYVALHYKDILEMCEGKLPVTVIDKNINDRMASTVRHNRARGKHSVDGMGNLVFSMLSNGWNETDVCHELGMEEEEIVRLTHVTGFSRLFENTKYRKAWKTKRQIKIEQEFNQKIKRIE